MTKNSETRLTSSIPAQISAWALKAPEAAAVIEDRQTLTYGDLEQRTDRIAAWINATYKDTRDPVITIFEFGTDGIVALLGLLKAGRPVVPLEPSLPLDRLQEIKALAGTKFALVGEKDTDIAARLFPDPGTVLTLSEVEETDPGPVQHPSVQPANMATLTFTSGSTGKPKGIIGSHKSYLHRSMLDSLYYKTGPGQRRPLFYSMMFGAGLNDVLGTLLNGATLCLYDLRRRGVLPLSRWIQETRLTFLRASVTILRGLLENTSQEAAFPNLALISAGGGKMFLQDLVNVRRIFGPQVPLFTQLASSETSLISLCQVAEALLTQKGYFPVGQPVRDKEIRILNEHGQQVPDGKEGEIAVRSRFLSDGYWGDPALTAEKFLPDPADPKLLTFRTGDLGCIQPDGMLVHLGRKDAKIRLRGHSVEPAEVKSALHALDHVKEAVVMVRANGVGENQLIAYILPMTGETISPETLRQSLSENLPGYMVPARFVFMKAFPLTGNAKVDRGRLPPPGRERPGLNTPYRKPQSAMEKILAQTWTTALEMDSLGVDDHFLELGGNSLVAMQIINNLAREMGFELPLPLLLDYPTVAKMAEAVADYQARLAPEGELAAFLDEIEGLSPSEISRILGEQGV